jgi:hypothetical protein
VRKKEITVRAVVVTTGMLFAGTAHAFDMGNMMNPSKWMGGDDDHDRYDDYGYGGPGYGYGGYPGYGYGGYPGYGYGATPSVVVPGGGSGSSEIEQLKDRIRELEGEVR